MRILNRFITIIAFAAVITFAFAACDSSGGGDGPPPPIPYTITGSVGDGFTAESGGLTKAAGDPIQDVIEAIKADANGAAVTIQFGEGTNLNIGTSSVSFNNTDGTWGSITLSGGITSSIPNGLTQGTIMVESPVNIISTGTIINTASGGSAIYLTGAGTLTVSGGIVQGSNTARAICLRSGTVSLTLTGGTVQASTGVAIVAFSGHINISGNALVTSASSTDQAIELADNDSTLLHMSGGTVRNTSSSYAIATYSSHTEGMVISGGTVQANGTAIFNYRSGGIIISGANTLITSSHSTNGTINLLDNSGYGGTLTVSSGTVQNTGGGPSITKGASATVNITSPPAVIQPEFEP